MRNIFIRVILSFVFLALATPAFPAETMGGPTVTLDQAIHFFAADGSDVVVGAGTYSVEATEEWLRVIPGERRDALLLEAQSFSHQERFGKPSARLIPWEEDQYSLILLLPDGKAMEAIGSISGVRSRAVRRARTARVPKARQSLSRIPSRTRRSSTLKRAKPYKRQAPQQRQGGSPAPTSTPGQNIQALEQRIQALEQQVNSLLSVIQISQGGEAIIQAQNLSLKSQNLTIETQGGSNGLTITSDTNLTINAALKLTAQSGTDLKLKGGLNTTLEGGAGVTVKGGGNVKVEGGAQLRLKGPIVYLGSGSGMKPLALVGSGVITAIGGGPGTVTTGSTTVLAK